MIKIISGQLKAGEGLVYYGNKEVNQFRLPELARIRAVLSQQNELSFPLSVAQVVMMGRYPHFTDRATSYDNSICEETMRYFEVSSLADRSFMSLSGGEKQRVHFARVLAQITSEKPEDPRYLLLDEPLTFLDIHYQFSFMHQIQELVKKQNITVIGVVHDLNLAAKFADQISLLCNGQLLANGDRQTVLTKETIFEAYQMRPMIHSDGQSMYLFFE